MRSAISPRAAQAFARALLQIDARPFLPLIHAPTLVLHRTGVTLIPIEHGRYLAERIPGARLIELPGSDWALPWEAAELAIDHVEEFLEDLRRPAAPDRVLATVLFTDLVGSTEQAERLAIGAGVSCWRSTTSWPAGGSRSSRVSWSRPPVMAS